MQTGNESGDQQYDDVLASMERLLQKTGAETAAAQARYTVSEGEWRLHRDQLRSSVEALSAESSSLKGGVLDVRADGGDSPGADAGLAGELAESARWRREGDRLRTAATDTARLPPLFPRARSIVRNGVVYAATMTVCIIVQFVLRGGMRSGWLPDSAWLWVGLLLPVMFLFIGYIITGITGRPKLPTLDDKGREVPFTVQRSPRLGVVLAVATMTAFLLT